MSERDRRLNDAEYAQARDLAGWYRGFCLELNQEPPLTVVSALICAAMTLRDKVEGDRSSGETMN